VQPLNPARSRKSRSTADLFSFDTRQSQGRSGNMQSRCSIGRNRNRGLAAPMLVWRGYEADSCALKSSSDHSLRCMKICSEQAFFYFL